MNDISLELKEIAVNKKKYMLNQHTYAALSNDDKNPLYNISVSNNSFSIDIWKGCLLQCAYCHVQGCYGDLREDGNGNLTMNYKPERRNDSTISEIVESLINYEGFINDYSPVSICTSSTEPFINEEITQSTIDIMLEFVKRGRKNPFWIVTKIGGIDQKWEPDIRKIIENGNKLLISVCWTNNNIEIEPYHKNRFVNLSWMADSGVLINWYMRPLVKEWNASFENIRYIMETARATDIKFVSICTGGLRWTEGIEFALECIHHIDMPELIKNDNEKTLSPEIEEYIEKLSGELFPDTPIFFRSCCALSHAFEIPNINLLQFSADSHCDKCPAEQRKRCNAAKNAVTENIDTISRIFNKDFTYSYSKYGYWKVNHNTSYSERSIALKQISGFLFHLVSKE
ncbi:MAG: hypothetical protein K5770_08050 [Lachnospiraceae bacterium]|nr:hypothetical protein [Lachnospiraceae bacterium]